MVFYLSVSTFPMTLLITCLRYCHSNVIFVHPSLVYSRKWGFICFWLTKDDKIYCFINEHSWTLGHLRCVGIEYISHGRNLRVTSRDIYLSPKFILPYLFTLNYHIRKLSISYVYFTNQFLIKHPFVHHFNYIELPPPPPQGWKSLLEHYK